MQLIFVLLTWSFVCFGFDLYPPRIPDILNPPVPSEIKSIIKAHDIQTIDDETDQDPEVTPGLFQGDIAIDDEMFNYWRVGLRWDIFPKKLWKRRYIPYAISPLYDISNTITIVKAIKWLNALSCIKFIKWNGKQKDYIYISPVKYPKGCWSYVGKYGGRQVLSLTPADSKSSNCLGDEGRAMHELMHALGIFHEQSRADRDNFVKIHEENIAPGYKLNFSKQSLKNTTYRFEYDYNSIMHYGKYYFSRDKSKPTISPKKSEGNNIGQRKKLSVTDCLKINELYGCLKNENRAKRYHKICQIFGL